MGQVEIAVERRRRAQARVNKPRRTPSRAVRQMNSVREPRAGALSVAKFHREKLTELEAVIERLLFPVLDRFLLPAGEGAETEPDNPDARTRVDAPPTPRRILPRYVSSKLEAIELHLSEIFDERELGNVLDKFGRRISKTNGDEIERLVGIDIRVADPGVAAQLDNFRAINVSRIKSLAGQELVEITQLLERSEATGIRVEVLRKEIQERFDVTKSKADLLARDQTLSLNAQITRTRQTNLGIQSYIWTTVGDDRVRSFDAGDDTDHAGLDGLTFRWDTPPDVGDGRTLHPGEDYQCRCTAFPVLEELQESPLQTQGRIEERRPRP